MIAFVFFDSTVPRRPLGSFTGWGKHSQSAQDTPMDNLLLRWFENRKSGLESAGWSLVFTDGDANSRSWSVQIECEALVGGICHWHPELFEFQFNDYESGEVLDLETRKFDDEEPLGLYVQALLKRLRENRTGGGESPGSGRSPEPG